MIIDRNWAKPSGGGGGDNTKLKEIVEGTVTELTAEDLEGVEKIGDYSFAYKQKLVNVYLPVTTKTLGTYAFQSCTKLESINTQNIEEFNNFCFQYCSALKEIYLSEFVTKLGRSMFENCTNLKTIYCYCDKALITSNTFHSYGFDVVYCDYSGEAENGSAYTLKDGVLNIVQFHP